MPGFSITASVNTNLNVFNGSNPNGVWSLYVYDDTPGNDGNIANGWTLGLTSVNPINPPGTLGVGIAATPSPVIISNYLTYILTVTNLGLTPATNVVLTETLPAGALLVSDEASQGTVNSGVPGMLIFNLGTITNNGDIAYATNTVQALAAGALVKTPPAPPTPPRFGATVTNTVTTVNLANFSFVGHPAFQNDQSHFEYVCRASRPELCDPSLHQFGDLAKPLDQYGNWLGGPVFHHQQLRATVQPSSIGRSVPQ